MSRSPDVLSAAVAARAALAGNPSDGYGGAVLSIPVRRRRATVSLTADTEYRFGSGGGDAGGTIVVTSWSDVVELAARARPDTPHALALVTAATFDRPSGFALDVTTTVPRSVGLAGSSAIVIAVLRVLQQHSGMSDGHPDLHPDVVASTALSVEVEGLGIAAGLQDRVVQAYGRPMLMRFDPASMRTLGGRTVGTYRRVDIDGGLRFFVATNAGSSEPSQVVHGDLRERSVRGDGAIEAAMVELSSLAIDAAHAATDGDAHRLGGAMDRTFDLRCSITDVAPQMLAMIGAARAAGTFANSCGSGGSIVVLAPDHRAESAARRSLVALGCELVDV